MFKGKKILVVDDEVDLREILRDEFVFEGAEVQEATNGKEAFEMVAPGKFDVVLSDLRMPGGDGATLAREIRKSHKTSPVVILITGFADLRSEEAYALGADGYVTKPFHLEELKQAVHRLLEPIPKRWSQPLTESANKELKITESLAATVKNQQIQFGRLGLFMSCEPMGFRVGDLVHVQFADVDFQAWVRWTRSESGITQPDQRTGLGFEIAHVSEEFLPILLAHLQPVVATIPES